MFVVDMCGCQQQSGHEPGQHQAKLQIDPDRNGVQPTDSVKFGCGGWAGYTCIAIVEREETMLAIRLPENIETRLGQLAKETGLTKTALVREAILEHIDDLEDYFLAEARARNNRNTISLEDVERELGLAN
jgi:RHH-type rel operon transcriptional repressor/antitoxin RelB